MSNYYLLCEALLQINSETHDEYGHKAGGFLSQMEKFSTYFGLKLSYLVFAPTEQLSLTLQGRDTTVQETTLASEIAVSYLHVRRQRCDMEMLHNHSYPHIFLFKKGTDGSCYMQYKQWRHSEWEPRSNQGIKVLKVCIQCINTSMEQAMLPQQLLDKRGCESEAIPEVCPK